MDKSSHTVWNLIGGQDRTQGVFDDIVRSALLYKLKGMTGIAPVDPILTDAIFDLNSHDQVPMPMYNDTIINGQGLKEVLEKLEPYKGKVMFMTLPATDNGADAGIFSVDPDGFHYDEKGNIVMDKESMSHIFQVKEYLDYKEFKKNGFSYAKPLETEFFHIEKLKTYDKEIILIYIRDGRIFSTPELQDILKDLKGKLVYVLSSFISDLPQNDGTTLVHKKDHYNFLIIDVFSNKGRVIHVWFKEPASFKQI